MAFILVYLEMAVLLEMTVSYINKQSNHQKTNLKSHNQIPERQPLLYQK